MSAQRIGWNNDVPPLTREEELDIERESDDPSNFDDPERWVGGFRTNPIRSAIGIVIVLFLLLCFYLRFHS